MMVMLALLLLQCAEQADIYPLGNFIFNVVGQDLSSSGASCYIQLPLPEGLPLRETPCMHMLVSHAAASLQPGPCTMSQSRQILTFSCWPQSLEVHLSTKVLMHMDSRQTHAIGIRVSCVRAW